MRIDRPNNELLYDVFAAQKLRKIENEIKSLSDEYILNVNQEEYINMLVAKHTI